MQAGFFFDISGELLIRLLKSVRLNWHQLVQISSFAFHTNPDFLPTTGGWLC
jgi:hypothetical protein